MMVDVFGLKLRAVDMEAMLHFLRILIKFKCSPFSYDAITIGF